MAKGKMNIGQQHYRDLFKICRNCFNVEEVLAYNPYKSDRYKYMWINFATMVFGILKPMSERVRPVYSQAVFDRLVGSMDGYSGDESIYMLEQYFSQNVQPTQVEYFWFEQIKQAYHHGWAFDIDICFCRTDILKYNRISRIKAKEEMKAQAKRRHQLMAAEYDRKKQERMCTDWAK